MSCFWDSQCKIRTEMTLHSFVRRTPCVRDVERLRVVVPVSHRTFKWPHCTEPYTSQHDNNTVTIIFGQTAALQPVALRVGVVFCPAYKPPTLFRRTES